MNKLKKISMAAFGMLATVAPATAVFADETPTTDNSTTEKPAENVGRVNYVYKVKGTDTELGKGYKEGVIGEDFVINPEVIENYKYVSAEGEATGKFSNETPTVTFYYESTTAETPATTEQPKEEKPAEDKKKDDVEPTTTTSTTTSTTDKKDDVTTTTPSTTLKPAEKPADKPKEEEKPAEVVNPTIEKPVETNTGDKIVGSTDKGQVIVANDKGETSVVAPEKVGGEVKSDGSIQVKDKSGKLVKIPTTGVEAALVSIMLAGGSAGTAGISTFLRSKRNK
jgi:gram positive anchor domain protein